MATLEYEVSTLHGSLDEVTSEDTSAKLSRIEQESTEIISNTALQPIVNTFLSYEDLLQNCCGEYCDQNTDRDNLIMINPAMKEEYLHEDEFQKIFSTSKREFRAMPRWKRDMKKKELQLF